MTGPILPALTTDPRPGDHVETGVREESATMTAPRPMSEAPRDGTAVLLVVMDAEHGFEIGFWSDPSVGDTDPEDAGWYYSEASSVRIWGEPAGWFPLPDLPSGHD